MSCPVSPGHSSGIGYRAGATRSHPEPPKAEQGVTLQQLASGTIADSSTCGSTIDMSNASNINSTTFLVDLKCRMLLNATDEQTISISSGVKNAI